MTAWIRYGTFPDFWNEIQGQGEQFILNRDKRDTEDTSKASGKTFFRFDAFAKTHKMAKQKFRPTRLGGFSGAKAYI
jgi:hypothetical protein